MGTEQKKNHYLSLTLIGIGIGWLVGLSISPVVGIIISATTGIAASLVAFLTGVKEIESIELRDSKLAKLSKLKVNPAPLLILLAGMIFGSGLGVYARSHNWLGSEINDEIRKWEKTGWSDSLIAQKLFISQYGEMTSVLDTFILYDTLSNILSVDTLAGVYEPEKKSEDVKSTKVVAIVVEHNQSASKSEDDLSQKENIPYHETILFSLSSQDCDKICGNEPRRLFGNLIQSGKRGLLNSLMNANNGDSSIVVDILKAKCACTN